MSTTDQRTIEPIQQFIEYDGKSNPTYIGRAVRGMATGSSGWTIEKLSYDSASNLIGSQTATGAWDNRQHLTYT